MEFNRRLRELRIQHKYTMDELAKLIGVGKSAIGNYESGSRYPRKEILEALADIFNVDMDYLTCRTDVPNRFVTEAGSTAPLKGAMPLHDTFRIPLLGRVAAGEPIFDEGNVVGEVFVDPALVEGDTHLFALKVKGDSMSPKILDGDTLIVREQPDAENGEIVIVTVDGDEGTCKKLQRYPDSLALISLNPVYEPIVYTWEEVEQLPVRVVGKVIQSRHTF